MFPSTVGMAGSCWRQFGQLSGECPCPRTSLTTTLLEQKVNAGSFAHSKRLKTHDIMKTHVGSLHQYQIHTEANGCNDKPAAKCEREFTLHWDPEAALACLGWWHQLAIHRLWPEFVKYRHQLGIYKMLQNTWLAVEPSLLKNLGIAFRNGETSDRLSPCNTYAPPHWGTQGCPFP